MAEHIELTIGRKRGTALVSVPVGSDPRGGVVVGFHHWGLDAFSAEIVDRLADCGYAAIAPDHYHVLPAGVGHERRREFITDTQLVADMEAAADWLVGTARVEAGRLGVIGHCMGGRTTLLTLVSSPRFRCGCMWYGGSMFNQLGPLPAPADRLESIMAPFMGFFGNLDTRPSPAEVDQLETRLKALGKTYEFHRYAGVDHSFMFRDDGRYNEAAAVDSWARATRFLQQHLAVADPTRGHQ